MILLDHGLNVNYHRSTDGLTPLQYSIKAGNVNLMRCLLNIQNIDVNMRGQYSDNHPQDSKFYHQQPTLHMLVLRNNYDMMKQFLEHGERRRKKVDLGEGPLAQLDAKE